MPGKEEFYETLRYFNRQIELQGVDLRLNTEVTAEALKAGGYDEVVVASGIQPRTPDIPGIDHEKVIGYIDLFRGASVGKRVAIIGAGGIGFDVAEVLTHEGESTSLDVVRFMKEWGVDMEIAVPGGVENIDAETEASPREVFLLQRKSSKVGSGLGKTTGWIHRTSLKNKGVRMVSGVTYDKIDDEGFHITVNGEPTLLDVDHVIVCAGQVPLRTLFDELKEGDQSVHVIGGADVAAELDAKRAINQGARLAAEI